MIKVMCEDGMKRPLFWKQSRWLASKKLGRQMRKGKAPRGRVRSKDSNGGAGVYKGDMAFKSELLAKVMRKDGSEEDLGVLGTKMVTTAFVEYLVDSLINSAGSPMDVFKWHDAGTGVVGEAVGDTALGTPWGGARVSGTQVENAANIYETVATIPFTGTYAITEHGVFELAAVGVLCDRTVFTVINVDSGDSIQFTYRLTCTAGG